MKTKFDLESGILEIRTIQSYIETVTRNAGLRCSFRDNIPAPMTSKNELLIPRLNGDISQRDLKKLRWFVLHESLHHTKGGDSFDLLRKEFGEGHGPELMHDPLFTIYNVLEDERIERAGAKDYKGDGIILDEGWQISTQDVLPEIERTLKTPNVPDRIHRMGALWMAGLKARSDWSPSCIPQIATMEHNMVPELEKYIKVLENMKAVDKIRKLPETPQGYKDSFDLAKEIFRVLFEKDPDKHLQEKQQEGKDKQNGKKAKGKEGQGDQDPKNPSGSKYGPEGEKGGDPVDATVEYELFTHSAHSLERQKPGGSGVSLDYTKYLERGHGGPEYEPCDSIKVRYYRNDKESHPGLRAHEERNVYQQERTKNWVEEYRQRTGIKASRGFSNKVRQLLQIRSQAKYIGGQKKGRLHFKNIYRAGLPVEGFSERVFRVKHENDTLDTCVSILVDLSGSMNGRKLVHAIESASLLNESISRSLKIPVEISGFSEAGNDTFVGVIKEFDQTISDEGVVDNFAKATTFMKANADGEAIQFSYDRIKVRPEKRKILIVISDGSPAASRWGAIVEYTQKVTRQIEGEKLVELYAIGIMTQSVRHFYTNYVIIKDAEELENQVLNLIKRSIFRER